MARLLIITLLAMASFTTTADGASGRPDRVQTASAPRKSPARRASARKLGNRSPVALALATAERYWEAVPCAGQVTILAARPLPPGLESSTDGWVTFDSSLGVNNLQAPAATYTRCTITLARWQWPSAAAMRLDWNMLCLTVIHELGHLLGHPHSLVPGSVMAPVFTSESSVPPICRVSREQL